MGLEPGPDHGGVSHAGRLAGAPEAPERLVFFECIRNIIEPRSRQVGAVEWPYKAVIDLHAGHENLYDLAADPEERQDLREARPEVFQPLGDAIRALVRRHEGARFARMFEQRVGNRPPNHGSPAVEVAPGLEWLGSRMETRRHGEVEVPQLHTWMRAVGETRPDVELRVEVYDARDRRVRGYTYRPLAGLYPTTAWHAGDVVQDTRTFRVKRRIKRPLRIELAFLQGPKVVFGPRVVGEIPR